ncbi:MAG: hypothetical protein ABJP70_04105 [Erythrobacter sp.]
MLTDDEAETYLESLKTTDPNKLRRQIAMNQLGDRKRALAIQFLKSEDKREISTTARSAKNAAWAAAIAAVVAAIATIVMAVTAYYSLSERSSERAPPVAPSREASA